MVYALAVFTAENVVFANCSAFLLNACRDALYSSKHDAKAHAGLLAGSLCCVCNKMSFSRVRRHASQAAGRYPIGYRRVACRFPHQQISLKCALWPKRKATSENRLYVQTDTRIFNNSQDGAYPLRGENPQSETLAVDTLGRERNCGPQRSERQDVIRKPSGRSQ